MARALSRLGKKKGRTQATHQFMFVGLHGPCGPYPATIVKVAIPFNVA